MQFFKKLLETLENRKKKKLFGVRTKLLHYKVFSQKNLLAIEMKKAEILINKLVNLGLSILELSKILMYEFWYDYVKPIHGEKIKLCYMDTVSFIVYIKTEDIYKDIAEDVETRFDSFGLIDLTWFDLIW